MVENGGDAAKRSPVAWRLRLLRQRILGLKQTDLAGKLGVTNTALSNYETGRRPPTIEFLSKLQRQYQVNVNWILTGRGTWRLGQDFLSELEKEGPVLHADDLELVEKIRKRLESPTGPGAFSRTVVIAPGDSAQTLPAGGGFRALPYVGNESRVDQRPFAEADVKGYFVVEHDPRLPPESLRCVKLPHGDYRPDLPMDSIVAVDIRQISAPPGALVLVRWEDEDKTRHQAICRLVASDPRVICQPLGAAGRAPGSKGVESERVRIVGRVRWAWHRLFYDLS
jgi:transcriptional regulator with XRE-family HTH domain